MLNVPGWIFTCDQLQHGLASGFALCRQQTTLTCTEARSGWYELTNPTGAWRIARLENALTALATECATMTVEQLSREAVFLSDPLYSLERDPSLPETYLLVSVRGQRISVGGLNDAVAAFVSVTSKITA